MRTLVSAVFIASLLCFSISQEYLNMTTCAYGGESGIEDKIFVINKSYLLAKKEEGKKDFIYEQDIIIITDEQKSRLDDNMSRKEVAGKKKTSHSLDLAFEYIKKDKKYEARNILSDIYFNETDNKIRNKIKTELDRLNAELVFSTAPSPDSIIYFVKPGETLIKIASKFDTTYKSIMRINRKSRSTIKVGERLKILNGKISLLVDKSDFNLTVLLNGHFIKQYPVGIGMYDKTPEDVFIVKNKLENPVWYSPEGVYQPGDPRNLLGPRWIGFEEKEDLYGYGIHGTTEPETIGKAMSNGCIRLNNEDVEELYDFVKVKTKVIIQK
ncbi:MAG: L,D-transpeptidase family protein [Candidatus Scalinduaceae bacterium]